MIIIADYITCRDEGVPVACERLRGDWVQSKCSKAIANAIMFNNTVKIVSFGVSGDAEIYTL